MGKETQLYNTTTICLVLGGRKKHTHTTDKLFLQDQTSVGGAAAPSAPTPPSAESDLASDGDTVGGSPPQRKMSAPRLGHRRQGLLQEPGPSRRPDRPLRSLSQPSPGDIGPAHGLGSPTPGLVPPVDDPAKLRPPLPRLLGLGSHLLLGQRSLLFEPTPPLSMLTRCLRLRLITERSRVSLTGQEKPRAARLTEPRDSYASGIRIPHLSPSAQGNSHLVKRFS
jgi:hypothetical protein